MRFKIWLVRWKANKKPNSYIKINASKISIWHVESSMKDGKNYHNLFDEGGNRTLDLLKLLWMSKPLSYVTLHKLQHE
jgi:starvation-inducible outer membrane lipoprotein